MASPATIPMFDSKGNLGDVPTEHIWDAVQAGGKIAMPAIAPNGSRGYVPHDQMDAARAKGARIDSSDAETQGIFNAMKEANPPSPSLGETVAKSFGLGNIAKNVVQGVKELGSGAEAVLENLGGNPGPAVSMVEGAVDQHKKAQQDFAKQDIKGKVSGAGHELAAALPGIGPFAAGIGEQAGTGDVGGAVARGGVQTAAGAAVKPVAKAAGAAIEGVREGLPAYTKSADELAGTTPDRIAELKTVPERMAAVHKLAVDTEAKAKAAAKAAYPDVKKPVVRTHVELSTDPNPLSPGAEEAPIADSQNVVQEKVPFKQVQEEYSELGQQIAREKRAVANGAKPAFDLQAMTQRYSQLADEMRTAAKADGKLPQFEAAQAQWRRYMEDFHNRNSPVRSLLDATPDQTAKIANHILNADKGARTLEVLRRNGADTSGVEKILSKGSTPLKVDVTESAKLRKAGSPENYRTQRLNEALDQATTNRLPSGSEAKLPAKAMKSRAPGILDKVPFADETISPRAVTRAKLRDALSGKK